MANVTSPVLNTVYANILYKGHGKDKTIDNSYRTISTCSLVAKTLDLYIRDLCSLNWDEVQAKTQFQGKGMSHELAALLLTETIQHSTLDLKLPITAVLASNGVFNEVSDTQFIIIVDNDTMVYLTSPKIQ